MYWGPLLAVGCLSLVWLLGCAFRLLCCAFARCLMCPGDEFVHVLVSCGPLPCDRVLKQRHVVVRSLVFLRSQVFEGGCPTGWCCCCCPEHVVHTSWHTVCGRLSL